MLIFDILIGLLTGLYSGLIASKYLRYITLRTQAVQIVKQVEQLHAHQQAHTQDDKHVALAHRRELKHLSHLAHELHHIGYEGAAQKLHDVEAILQQAHENGHSTEDLEAKLDLWIDSMRRYHPALLPTLQAWRS